MIHPIRAWNRFFFRPTSARPLGAIRILFGLLALANLAFTSVDLDYWFTESGLLRGGRRLDDRRPLTSTRRSTGSRTGPRSGSRSPSPPSAAVLLTIGWRTRLMSILFYLGMLSIHNRNLVSSSGADVLLMTFAFNLMLCPCGAAYSVDAWLEVEATGDARRTLDRPLGRCG